MRRIETWLCLVALLLVGAVAAADAAAAELEGLPAFGLCVPAEGHTGEYKGGACIQKSPTGTGNYNFVPGPGPNPKFEGTIGPTKLETVGKAYVIQCSFGTATGEYSGQKTAKVSLALVGCLNITSEPLQKCQTTPAKEAEIETTPIEGELGYIRGGEQPKVGLDLKPAPPIVFTCGLPPEVPTVVTVEGSAIGLWAPPDRMRSTFRATYTASGGKQNPESFEGGAKDTLSLTRVLLPEVTTEPVGLTIIGVEEKPKPLIIENQEPIEIKAK
jgi:hypothetical protein